ncbi:MAG: sugar-binding protein [Christensenellales bacterium]|jgi:hypothetical protein|nr:hypothetical protein [Clostridiales bacterium]
MKKMIRSLLVLVLATCMLVGVSFAETTETDQPTATAHKAVDIVLDGKLDEWNLNDPIIINDPTQLVRDHHFWNGPDDLSAKVYIAWDETYFYIGADVTEDSVFGAIEMLPMDGMDNFQLYLSTNPADDPSRTEYATNDFKVFLIMDGEYWDTAIDRSMVPKDNRQRFISKGMDGGENVLEGYEVAATQTTTGFIYEAKIPWACFSNKNIPVYTPAVGDTVNFNFLITDISYPCPGTEYIPQIAWSGTAAIDTNPSQWGRLTFAE